MRVMAVIQARMGSTRLPGKVLKEISPGISVLSCLLHRLSCSTLLDKILVATTNLDDDEILSREVKKLGYECFKGNALDVLNRYFESVQHYNLADNDYVVRVTGDCPLLDPKLVDEVIDMAIQMDLDFCNNTMTPTYPDGMDVAVMKYKTLKEAQLGAILSSDREHVTPYIVKKSTYKGGEAFKSDCLKSKEDNSGLRITVDEQKDLDLIQELVKKLGISASCSEYVECLKENKELREINSNIERNEGYFASLRKENE